MFSTVTVAIAIVLLLPIAIATPRTLCQPRAIVLSITISLVPRPQLHPFAIKVSRAAPPASTIQPIPVQGTISIWHATKANTPGVLRLEESTPEREPDAIPLGDASQKPGLQQPQRQKLLEVYFSSTSARSSAKETQLVVPCIASASSWKECAGISFSEPSRSRAEAEVFRLHVAIAIAAAPTQVAVSDSASQSWTGTGVTPCRRQL